MATGGQLTWATLVAIARRVGVTVVEAPSSHRGKLGSMGSVVGVTCHHTGTPNTLRPTEDYPDYAVVKEGRTGLVNSLSAYGIGRHTSIYVFSEFLSWHAGTWNWKGITDGNGHFLGLECAGVGDYTEFQRKVYPRLVAAILLEIGQSIDWAPRHAQGATPAGRKTDAANLDGDFYQGKSFRQWVEFFLVNPAHININYLEDDMPTAAEVADAVWTRPLHSKNDPRGDWGGQDRLTSLDLTSQTILNEVRGLRAVNDAQAKTIAELSQAVAKLSAGGTVDASKLISDIQAKIESVQVKLDVVPQG